MSFPTYPDYKESEVAWLGPIPSHWTVSPLKCLAEFKSGGTPDKATREFWDGDVPWASAKDLKSGSLFDTVEHITDKALEVGAATLVEPGTLLVVVRGMILARLFPVTRACVPMAINQDLKAVVAKRGLSSDFLAWLLRGSEAETLSRLDEAGHGTKALRMDAWTAMRMPVPPIDEQRMVSSFLDRETAKIDALVDEQRLLIDLLKEKRHAVISQAVTKGLDPSVPMKDSGVEWLGKVPAHWEIAPIGARYSVQLGKMLDTAKITGANLRPYLRVFDVQWGRINTEGLPMMDFDADDRSKFRLVTGDLLINEGGSYPGRAAIWSADIEECYYQKALHRLRVLDAKRDTSRFLFYLMVWATEHGVFSAGGNEATIEHLPAERLRRYRFPFPQIHEQVSIAKYIADQSQAFESMMSESLTAVQLLQERRAALISAAVTGKIDVRGLVPQSETVEA